MPKPKSKKRQQQIKHRPDGGIILIDVPLGDTTVEIYMRPLLWNDQIATSDQERVKEVDPEALDPACVLLSRLVDKWQVKGEKARDSISALELHEDPVKYNDVMRVTNSAIARFLVVVDEFVEVE